MKGQMNFCVIAGLASLLVMGCGVTISVSPFDSVSPSPSAITNTSVPWPPAPLVAATQYPWRVPAATMTSYPWASAQSPLTSTAGWRTFSSAKYGFSFKVPPGSSELVRFGDRDRIMLPIAPGTNLAEKYLEISVVEGGHPCRSALGSAATVSQPRVFNGTRFLMESGSEVAAGNFYEWTAFSTSKGTACISLTFVLHSHDADSYQLPMGQVDKEAEGALFSAIMFTYLSR